MGIKPEITVEIESLVIEGLTAWRQTGAVLQSELQRLFTERGLPVGLQSGAETMTLNEPIELRPGLRPDRLGALAAQALFARWER
jgi:hypothetical protein